MILVSRGPSVEEALRILEEAGVSTVWSEESQTVHLSDFVSSRRVRLGEALDRVLPGDPRHTPWLDGLAGFYRTGDGGRSWSILYVPRASGSRALRALSKSLEGSEWLAPGGGTGRGPGLGWAAGILLAAFCVRDARRGRPAALAAGLPFAPLWFSGAPEARISGIWGYLTLLILLEEADPESGNEPAPGFLRATRILGPSAAAFLLGGAGYPEALPAIGISALSAGCVYLGIRNLESWKTSRRVHEVFRAVPLDPRRTELERDTARRRRTRAGLAAAGLVLAGLLPAGWSGPAAGENGLPPLPEPGERIARGVPDAAAVERLAAARSGSDLPSLADAVAHRAYQEALPYSRIGRRAYGSLEAAVLDRYSVDGTDVNRVLETILVFDDPWVRNALREEEESGIGAVLADQRGIVKPGFGAPGRIGRPERLVLRDVFFYIILLAPAALGAARPGSGRIRGSARPARSASRR